MIRKITMQAIHHNLPEFSVTEISQALKKTVETSFSHVRIRGEISSFKVHTSGHAYFTLKDEASVLDAVCWRGSVTRLQIRPEEGMEVIATGKLTTYPGRSKYQIVVESMEIAGEGALLKLLEDRKKKFAAEGLFDDSRKKPLPLLPKTIGVVTSPTGAVIQDILHRIEDRFPSHVIVWPVLVQGEGAAQQISHAIQGFNALETKPELLIVARGGGSLEDLWCFNEEIVVRAIAQSSIPLISAVGHETDVTLCDFVADKRAPTPTAAAEFAVPVRRDLATHIQSSYSRLQGQVQRKLSVSEKHVESLGRGIPNLDSLLGDWMLRIDDWSDRLAMGLKSLFQSKENILALLASKCPHPQHSIEKWETKLESLSIRLKPLGTRTVNDHDNQLGRWVQLLESYSYERTLDRGFSLTLDASGHVVSSVKDLRLNDEVTLRFKDGDTKARVNLNSPINTSN